MATFAALVVVLVLLAVLVGAVTLVVVVARWLARPWPLSGPLRPPPPDDWDDEEISARYHH